MRCDGAQPVDVARSARLAGEIRARRERGPDADALQAAALLDLISGDTSVSTMRRSISFLETSVRIEPTASRYADLAAARLSHGATHDDAKALFEGLDAAGQALSIHPENSPARFNHALALDLLGLDEQATKAWRAALAVDSSSAWAAEARARIRAIASFAPVHAPGAGAPLAEFGAFARRAPAEAQLLAWESLLKQWGAAVSSGDNARASDALERVGVIGEQLHSAGRDASVRDARLAIARAGTKSGALRLLAIWHSRFATAQDLGRLNAYASADTIYRALLEAQPKSEALLSRAALAHVNALIYAQRPESALIAADLFLKSKGRDDEPLLAGRAHWYAGVLLLRKGQTDTGLVRTTRSGVFFERAGDAEGVAGALGVEGEVRFQSGDVAGGYDIGRRVMLEMRGRGPSLWRHNQLLVLSRAAARGRLMFAARAIDDEDAAGAKSGTRLVSVVEAQLQRARGAWKDRRAALARSLTDSARVLIQLVPDSSMKERLRRDVDVATSGGLLRDTPDSAVRLLSRVITADSALNFPTRLIPALVMRAAANLTLGRETDAERDLSFAAARFDAARAALQSAALQRTLASQAREVYDSLVVLRIRKGDTGGALASLERSRVTFGQLAEQAGHVQPTVHADGVIDYALIGDHLFTWTLTRSDTLFKSGRIDRAELGARVERVRAGLELGVPELNLRGDLHALYDQLVRPFIGQLTGDRIRIVPDGELAQVPFGVLWDAARTRYLVEGYATSLSPTLANALSLQAVSLVRGRVVIVANPALEGGRFSTLPALPAAGEEAAAVARLYAGSVVLDAGGADSARVAAAMPGAELIHFAGHAILDDAQPWRSALALRPRGLTATAVAKLDLRTVKLAVLSACETMRSPDGATGGFAGLTDAFMAAGAGGVVGSLWRVGDEDAARLMKSFHRAFYDSGDAAQALRVAQVSMLRARRPPGSWAAFRYAGR